MKTLTLITAIGLLLGAQAVAADGRYVAPETLTKAEAKQAKTKLLNTRDTLKSHWQARLLLAKKRQESLRNTGYLNRPYYGDHGGAAQH